MRIGIDCRTILNPGRGEQAGVGHYNYYLVKNLLKIDKKNEYVLFFDWRVTNTREFKQKNTRIYYFPFSQYKKYLPFTYSHMLISATLVKEKLDVYHSPANVIPYMYPRPSVITVHDLAIYKHPSWFPPGQKFSTKLLVPKSLHKAKKIIAVSQATKKDIIKLFKISSARIETIYQGVVTQRIGDAQKNKEYLRKKYKIKDKYILYVGTIEPRKNLISLLRAFSHLLHNYPKRFKDYQLIITGGEGWKAKDVFRTIKELDFGQRVKWIGYVSHDDKIALMKNASCFVFPTLYEGFGLPVLEAMSLGVPVITSKVASIPEVTGKAALLVNPNKVNELIEALNKVLGRVDLRRKMIKEGLEQAQKFSWPKCARETLAIYRKAYQEEMSARGGKRKEETKKKGEKKKQPKKKKSTKGRKK